MKNKEFHKLLKKNKFKSNSGFTLTELLVGLFLSTFVIGALGFGLAQVLRITQEEGSFAQARSETTRAMDFITDEIRRARMIEDDDDNADNFRAATITGADLVFALDIPDADDGDPSTSDRVVYYLKSTGLGTWEGPQVLYRWGPPLDQNGNYTNGTWNSEALIDKIDNTIITSNICGTGQTLTPALANNPSGFYACIDDDDNDGITEAEINDDNSNGVIDDDDVDGTGISAQVYFTGGVDTAVGDNTSNYSTNSQVVARAREPEENNPGLSAPSPVSFKSLGAVYGCDPSDESEWTMRTDFANDVTNPNRSTKWVYRKGEKRQPQPLKITNKTLAITSVPIDPRKKDKSIASSCLNDSDPTRIRGNRDLGESEALYETDSNGYVMNGSDYTPTTDNKHTVKHTVDFDDPTTFNGFENGNPSRDDKFVMGSDKRVVFLKEGTILSEDHLVEGYDPDDVADSGNEQESLGEFLANHPGAYARKDGDNYIIQNLNPNERIVAFEIGWEETSQAGFDNQDNVFLMTSDLFTEKFDSDDF